jgi:hypothetical protein
LESPTEPEQTGYYVYGMVRAGEVSLPAELVGIDGAPVRTVDHGDIAAVVAEISLERPPGRRSELLAHSAVLDALLASGVVVVPVRFGSFVADSASLVNDLLEPSADYVATLLEELTGRAQYNLRATYHESVVLAEIVAADPDIASLRDVTRDLPEEAAYAERVRLGELVARALEEKRRIDSNLLLDAILPFVDAHVERGGGDVDHLLDIAILVDDDVLAELEEQLEAVAESVHERIRLRLVGPLVPYDFVGEL